jgi:Protein of unknown function (DUF2807).
MKNRFRLIAFLSVILLTSIACGITRQTPTPIPQTNDKDQNVLVSEFRQLGEFTKIDMDGGAKVNLVQGSEHSITVEGSRRVIDQVLTQVKDGVLEINYRDRKLFEFWAESLTLTITFKDLSNFRLDGGVELKADDLTLEDFNLTINGGASVRMNNLLVNTLSMTLTGGGNIEVSGIAENHNVKVSGGTNYQAEDLKSANVSVEVIGAANVVVWATERLNLDLAGAYSVSYWGSPQITQSVTGLGEIKALGEK